MTTAHPVARATSPTASRSRLLLFRAVLGLLVLVLLPLGYLTERVNNERHLSAVRAETHRQLAAAGDRLSANLHADLQLVRGLISVINLIPDLDQAKYEEAVRPLFEGRTQLRNVAAAPDMVVRLMYPVSGNEAAIGLDYRKVPAQRAAAERARDTREVVLAGPLNLVQGGVGLIARLPVFVRDDKGNESFWGLVSAVIESERLFRNSGLLGRDGSIEFALRGLDSSGPTGPVFLGRPAVFDADPERVEINLPQGSWLLAAMPRTGWPQQAVNVWEVRGAILLAALVMLAVLGLLARVMSRADAARARAESAQQQLANLIEQAPDAMVMINREGNIEMVNRQTELLFGWDRGELLGKSPEMLVAPQQRADYAATQAHYLASIEGPGTVSISRPIEGLGWHREGRAIDVEVSLRPMVTEKETLAVGMLRDVRARKRAEARAEQSERRVSVIADQLPVLISHVNAERKFTFANAAWLDIYKVRPQDMVGRHIREALGEEFYVRRQSYIEDCLLRGMHVRYDADALGLPLRHLSVTLIPDRDEQGRVIGMYTLGMDVTAQKKFENELTTQARIDHLTGLPNRRSFEDRLQEAAARQRRSRYIMSVMYVDIDHFKQVNDSLGHAAGDAVLQAVAQRLRASVRGTDTVVRLGGDEFVVLLEALQDSQEAARIAEKILSAVREPIALPSGSASVTVSIGVGLLTVASETPDTAEVLNQADHALYQAKRSGRDNFFMQAAASDG